MPRRRGSTNAGRRTTIDDGRCNGNNKKPMAPIRAAKVTAPAVSPSQSVNEATPEATQSSDLGYLHKKFKKVAATFSTTPEPALPAVAADPPTDESCAVVVDPAKKEDQQPDSNGSSKSSSKGGRYVCHYCQHACAKPSVLEKHIRAHTNERPYPCVPCGFAFKTKSNLYKHCKSRTHVLKLEENGTAHSQLTGSAGIIIDPVEGGSDDTSDDNVMLDDSDEGEPLVVAVPPQPAEIIVSVSSAPSTPEKFKTPYKPKFHNLKSSDDILETPPTTDEGRPSPGFLHERISQIISKNQAIVETLDPIWPRRYVRQSSRDNKETAKSPRPDIVISSPSIKKSGLAGRERSCSLSLVPHADQTTDSMVLAVPSSVAPSSTHRLLQEDENQRKRCYSEGPAVTEIRHSVRNLLQQSPKPPRTDVFNPQNPEGSIIKDILLKSRGLLPANCEAKESAVAVVDPPTKMSSSFTVSALLNPSTTRAKPTVEFPHPHISLDPADDPAERPPSKRSKISDVTQSAPFPRPPVDPEMIRSTSSSSFVADRIRTSLPLFGGEVEIHDGPQRTVLRIDPAGYVESNRSNGQSTATAESPSSVVVTKVSNLNNSGGLFRLQPQESRISVFPVMKTAETKSGGDPARGVIIHQPSVPYIPGIPGPYSSSGWLPASTMTSVTVSYTTTTTVCTSQSTTTSQRPVPSITVHPPAASLLQPPHPEERTDSGFDDEDPSTQASPKFLRPNSLSLQPGTFNLKKSNMAGLDPQSGQPNMLCVSGAGMTLISPETPRPRKLFRQLYLNGHAYTYLGLKCSTRVYFCCLSRAQPMYVPHHPKLSMYSQWKTRAPASAGPPGLEASSPTQTMSLYDSRQRPTTCTTAQSTDHGRMILTHSSYWTNRDRPTTTHFKLQVTAAQDVVHIEIPPPVAAQSTPEESRPPDQVISPTAQAQTKPVQPKRVRIFAGGYKSTEDYTYVRGRGRGRYVCEECGIRCKKPSMLKKHIRTHTDLRPYTCRQCNFSFKTKGNLTKHMKSKAHHKKCTELGIVPVPTTVDEANIDEDSLARQETLKKMKLAGGSGNEGDSDLDDDEDEDEDDEEDEEIEGEEEEDETEDDPPVTTKLLPTGQFEDATAAEPVREEREQEVARSLLDLGVIAPAGCKPTTYPYASHFHPPEEEQHPSVEMKEEPPAPVCKQQPMDLSTSTAASSALLASIYSPIVSETAARRLSPENSVQPATSGMLQAYLTEKALKEGLMKRHQVKLMTPPSVVVENPVVTLFPTQSKSSRSEFVVPLSSTCPAAIPTSVTAYKLTDDGKTACSICNKVFTKPSQLRLHINIHYFERPFRCEACAVSFRTKGHLQKHKRSVTHFNKVNMNLTFGTPSTENPRPFKCSDCMIAFRIHGHLAKHLRSKMHIMKLECLGKLPFGTYAEMERSGINLNEIDTTDCHNSLESLQSLAHRLYKQDPSKIQQWQQEAQVVAEANLRERTISESSEEFSDVADDELDEDGEDSDGLPDGAGVEEAPPPRKSTPVETLPAQPEMSHPPRAAAVSPDARKAPPPPPVMYCSACGDSCVSMEAFQSHVMEKHRPLSPPTTRTPFKASPPATAPESPAKLAPPSNIQPDIGRVVNLAVESRRSPSRVMETGPKPGPPWNRGPGDLQYAQPRGGFYSGPPHSSSTMWPPPQPRQPTIGDLMSLGNPLSAIPPQWHQDQAAMAWIASRHMMLPGHPPTYTTPHHSGGHHTTNGVAMQPRLYSPTSSSSSIAANDVDVVFPCELCGKSFNAKETLRQHMLAHAQPRPFVCEFCDAGFTTQKHLESHLVLHRPRTS
ncbi:transcription factor HIVEP3-like isoform X2 [Daphnia pulicaria]|uniref:transcription factor HIVEP3-like isoform X2 n=1 Tax=Daphnia pulicaria TaxID=35523 RepID=UPI001EEA798C|nr:transcription factor HIVEP3-like isoform X2 [Daphnia pulicaria]